MFLFITAMSLLILFVILFFGVVIYVIVGFIQIKYFNNRPKSKTFKEAFQNLQKEIENTQTTIKQYPLYWN